MFWDYNLKFNHLSKIKISITTSCVTNINKLWYNKIEKKKQNFTVPIYIKFKKLDNTAKFDWDGTVVLRYGSEVMVINLKL